MLLPELKGWLEVNIKEANELKELIGGEDIPYLDACLKLVNWHLEVKDTSNDAIENWLERNA